MTEDTVIVNRKKSELNAKDSFDYEKLIHCSPNLISCSYREKDEEVIFSYECEHLICSSNLKKEDKLNQFQFLVNFSKLYELYTEYRITFSPDNIYYDENYMPCIKERDLHKEGQKPEEEYFLFIYKTFVASVLGKEYTVMQLQESGLEVLEKEKETDLTPYMEAKTREELLDLLRKGRKQYYDNRKNNTVRIPKRENQIKNIVLVVAPLLLVAALGVLIYHAFFLIPYQESVIAANEAYVQKNYVACIDSMENIDVDDMTIQTKFILAYSYAKSESLEKEEIDMLTSRLSVNSNERELEYWIYLGRMEMEKAESLAQALSDDKLLIYAYLKDLNMVQNNTSMEGEEKQSRISQLENLIQSLGDKYAPEEEETGIGGATDMETTETVPESTQTTEPPVETAAEAPTETTAEQSAETIPETTTEGLVDEQPVESTSE